jgi:hypothetical protein
MQYKVKITGSTGMVGKGVLLECLDHKLIKEALVINRKTLNIDHPKLKEILLKDFNEIEKIGPHLEGYNACFFSMGISYIGILKDTYERVTHDLTIKFSKVFLKYNPNSIFTYVSGAGTDSSESGKIHWAKIKGKTENKILKMPFKASYMFRPGFIHPYRGVRSKTLWVNILYIFFGIIYQMLKYFPSTATISINVGKAMIYCLNGDYDKKILNNKEINEVSDLL